MRPIINEKSSSSIRFFKLTESSLRLLYWICPTANRIENRVKNFAVIMISKKEYSFSSN
jgi:hypothetical protein